MTLVLDASVTIAALCPDEDNRDCVELLEYAAVTKASVPSLWACEVCNILEVKGRQKKISRKDIELIHKLLRTYEAWIELGDPIARAIAASTLADKYKLSVYDATYLELALRLRLPLATLDKRLATAASQAGIEVLPNPA